MAQGISRPRKPTSLLLSSRHAALRNPHEPAGAFAIPAPPAHLDKDERAAWAKFAKSAARMRITTADDFAAFQLLALTWAEAEKLRAIVRKEGMSYVQKNGMIRARPEARMLGDVERRLLNLLARFGLTPSDRSRVADLAMASPNGSGDDEFAGR